jgi:F-type H+-transporting ATPase subunit b
MIFNVWTFLFQVINFLALVYILRRLLYRPLREAIDRRREAHAQAQAEADAARREAASLQQELSERIVDLDRRREETLRETRERAEVERQAALAEAECAIRRRREEVEQQVARDRDEALRSLRGELVGSAVALAERFLNQASHAGLHRQLGLRLVEQLARIPEEERERLRTEWDADDSAVLETAAELNGDLLQAIDTALKSLVGRRVDIQVQARPALVGGLRLRIGGEVWDASLAGALEEARTTAAARAPS